MGFTPFTCALGDSPAVSLPCAATVNISPGDDSVDTNRVIITGSGTINSFGTCQGGAVGFENEKTSVTKYVTFLPDAGQIITLHHDPTAICLLGKADRAMSAKCFGIYQSDPVYQNYWQEIGFSQDNVSPTRNGDTWLSLIYYNTSQTITIPTNATKAWIRMWGAAQGSYAAGGGAPGYLEKFLKGLVPGNTLIFTRGNGTPSSATSATVTTLASGTQTIGTLTCNPGLSGGYGAGGGTGGTATGGDINMNGGKGASATPQDYSNPAGSYNTGPGGVNMFARGADGDQPGPNGGMLIAWFQDAVA